MSSLGTVHSLYRHPVKSMMGEPCVEGGFSVDGMDGDREYALLETETGLVITGKRPPYQPLLIMRATWRQGVAWVESQDMCLPAHLHCTKRTLSEQLGRSVEFIRRNRESTEPTHTIRTQLVLKPGFLTDSAPVHLLTTTALAHLEAIHGAPVSAQRFRPNIVLETLEGNALEGDIKGLRLRVGEAVLELTKRTGRCAMPALAQGGLPLDPTVTRLIKDQLNDKFGLYARVLHPGLIKLGAQATLL